MRLQKHRTVQLSPGTFKQRNGVIIYADNLQTRDPQGTACSPLSKEGGPPEDGGREDDEKGGPFGGEPNGGDEAVRPDQ